MPIATAVEKREIRDMLNLAEKVIEREDKTFENTISSIHGKCTAIEFMRSDKFAVGLFQYYRQNRHLFVDKRKLAALVSEGEEAIANGEFKKLRNIIIQMFQIMRKDSSSEGLNDIANIMRG